MSIDVPSSALQHGFVNSPGGGTHNSRTLMLSELRLLLAYCASDSTPNGYRVAIIDDNVLLKGTMATRLKSLRALRELYALDASVLLFRALRDLWDQDLEAQPVMALLCGLARDPVLRATSNLLLDTPTGTSVTSEMLAHAAAENLPGRYKSSVFVVVGRNTASSWQQSGHLEGRSQKIRARAATHHTSTVYALLLGYLCGARGDALFTTLWSRLLDTPTNILHAQAAEAAKQGWLDYKHGGGITEVGFRYLLRDLQEVTADGN